MLSSRFLAPRVNHPWPDALISPLEWPPFVPAPKPRDLVPTDEENVARTQTSLATPSWFKPLRPERLYHHLARYEALEMSQLQV
jgi:hypothetical protein